MADSSDEENAVSQKYIAINNIPGLHAKLEELHQDLEWIERLDVDVDLATLITDSTLDTNAESDFKREIAFYNQALSAATRAIAVLDKQGIPTRRPTDYLAEMAKSDMHMQKVREKLLSKQMAIEHSEKIRELRQQKKHGKKVQQEILQQRKSEKMKMIHALKRTKKGKPAPENMFDDKKGMSNAPNKKHKKSREFRDSKYGYGGKKKGSKYNTSESSSNFSGNKRNFKSGGKDKKPRPKKTRRRR